MERGWTSDEEAMTWLEGFIKSIKTVSNFLILQCNAYLLRANPDNWKLLLLDGHGSHKTIKFIHQCLEHKVSDYLGVVNILTIY